MFAYVVNLFNAILQNNYIEQNVESCFVENITKVNGVGYGT